MGRIDRPEENVTNASIQPTKKVIAHVQAELARIASWNAELGARRGNLQAVVDSLESTVSDSEASDEDREINRLEREVERLAEFTATRPRSREIFVRCFADQMADAAQWRALASKDLRLYRSELDLMVRGFKGVLNIACGNKPYRPRDTERYRIILDIKTRHPKYSFGEVAKDYGRITRKPMTAKYAERIYKRALQAKQLHEMSSLLEQIQNATEA